MKHLGDITKIDGHNVPLVDIVTGGSPCQDLSVAGKRAGLAGERSGLFMEQIKIIKEMRNESIKQLRLRGAAFDIRYIQPRYMVWENVPGAFSSNKGEDFRAVLEETAKVCDKDTIIPRPENGKWSPSGCILGNGWSIAWRVHDAQFWGVPQRRKRIALVADFGGDTAPKILFKCESVSRDIEESQQTREEIARAIGKNINKTIGQCWDGSQTSPTLTANNAGGSQRMPDKENFNAVITYSMQRSNEFKQSNNSHTLAARDYKDSTDLVVGSFYPQMKAESQCWREDNVSNTLVNGTNPGFQNGICTSVVRRLTPMECERLQGYPDHWTDIGEWTDSKGKKHKDADSPRYKALGNSIALPFWEWMAKRMVSHLDTDKPTMASLFDGIGGFPLVYSRAGCEPIWASEIEEFPIAVTKIRFPEEEDK